MADNFKFVQAQPFRLYTSATSTQNTLIVSAFETPDGVPLTITDFGTQGTGTLDPELETEEIIAWTGVTDNGNGTYTLTGVSRGGNFRAPYDFDTVARGQPHATNAVFIVTNNPQFNAKLASKDNDETIAQTWTFTNPNVPRMDADPTYGAGTEKYFATKQYVDETAFAGAPNASTTQKGIVEIASQAENDAGTSTGGTGALLVATPDVNAKTIQDSEWVYATDTGVADAYAITITPAITAYEEGQEFLMKAANDNTGVSTLNVNALGVKTIKKYEAGAIADVAAGDIQAGGMYKFAYDGTFFQMQTPQANSLSSAVAAEATAFFTTTTMTGAEANTLVGGRNSDADDLHTHPELMAPKYLDGMTTASTASIFFPVTNVAYATTFGRFCGYNDLASDRNILVKAFHDAAPGHTGYSSFPYYGILAETTKETPQFLESGLAISNIEAAGGCVLIGSDRWIQSTSTDIYKGSTLVTISGTAPSATGALGYDSNLSYLLVQDSSTRVRRYSGIAGTTITFVDNITLDNAVDTGKGFIFDVTNNRYIFLDGSTVRRFDSSGTTIDTVSLPTSIPTTAGLCFIRDRVYVISMMFVGRLEINNDDLYMTKLVLTPTTMTR